MPSSSRASATRRRAAADVFGHLARLADQVAVRAAHRPVRQVEVVLDPGADVAAEHQRRAEQLPLVAGDADHLPLVGALRAAGDLVRHHGDVARGRADAAGDAHHQGDLQRRLEQAHVEERVEVGDVAGVEALVLGLDPELPHRGEELDDRVEAVLEDGLEDEVFAPARVLRVVHRAHVQRRHFRPALAQVLEPLLHRDPDRPGRVVDDHVVDRAADRLGDRLEVLDLVRGRAVGLAGVDVDLGGALLDRAARLGRVLLRRVGDRRALVAVGDHAADRAADDHRVVVAVASYTASPRVVSAAS